MTGRAADIAERLGGLPNAGAWSRCRCPLHDSFGPSLAPRDGDNGLIVKCFAGCPGAAVLAELYRVGLIDNQLSGDNFDERDAIISTPAEWVEGFARLDPDQAPGDMPERRWRAVVYDVEKFLGSGFAAQAAALGWSAHDLFGCDSDRPYAHR